MKDPVVLQQLRDKGITPTESDLLRYEAVERKPRVLDDVPPRIKVMRMDNPVPCGMSAQFIETYNESVSTIQEEVYFVDIEGRGQIQLDAKVFHVLRTLILSNISFSEELSQACADLFKTVTLCGSNPVTEGKLYSILNEYKTTNYSEKTIIETILGLCFSDNGTVLLWNNMAQSDGYYMYAIKRGAEYVKQNNMSEKDLKQFIREKGKSAKEDKEFMSKLIKGIPTKALIAMIYELRDDEKMFSASNVEDGFMG